MDNKKNKGRPTVYNLEIATELCRRLAEGESLRSICKEENSKFPCKSTVLLWVVDGKHPEFSDQYAKAREAAGYSHGDMVTEVAVMAANGEVDASVARVMMDCYKWAAERMSPKAYSVHTHNHLTGGGDNPIELRTLDASSLSNETLVELMTSRENGDDA